MLTKLCGVCKEVKPVSEFYRRYDQKTPGYLCRCKKCHGRITSANPKKSGLVRAWGQRNKERRNELARIWRKANPGKVASAGKRWRETHRDYVNGRKVHRILTSRQQTPKWSIKFFVSEARALARLRTRMTGFEWHVDHIVPLRHPLVCGLHAHTNIRVIPGRENLQKNNHHWPDMPC